MCKNPKRILNPSKWIDPYGCQPLYIEVPCGHCSECIISYRNDWRNRAYYETLDCFMKGGYVLFDTLTYRNGNLPHLSDWLNVPKDLDFPCFSKYDLDLFFANLRRKLRKYDVSHNVRYFVGCEYGDDIRFTRRPHYHVLFFCSTSIPWRKLSEAIASCWHHGRTDGVPYRGASYVGNSCVFTSLSESQKFSVNYVTKYCTKNFSYNNLVFSRLNKLKSFDFGLFQSAKDYILPNHFQSKSFGTDALLKFVGRDYLLENGNFKIIETSGFYRYVNLSKSIQRKLLYDYNRDDNGCVQWKLNKDGFVYKKKFAYRAVEFLAKRVAGNPFSVDYCSAKQESFDYLFKLGRFNSGNIDFVIDNSYNVDKGFRNYAAKDFEFIHKPVFTFKDYGSKKLGFQFSELKKSDLIYLNEVEKCVCDCVCDNVLDFKSQDTVKGDSGLDVLKLLHRLKFIHKCYDYA